MGALLTNVTGGRGITNASMGRDLLRRGGLFWIREGLGCLGRVLACFSLVFLGLVDAGLIYLGISYVSGQF